MRPPRVMHVFRLSYIDDVMMQGVKAAFGAATVPQVFIEGRLVGGADQLEAYFAQAGVS